MIVPSTKILKRLYNHLKTNSQASQEQFSSTHSAIGVRAAARARGPDGTHRTRDVRERLGAALQLLHPPLNGLRDRRGAYQARLGETGLGHALQVGGGLR